MASRRTLLDPLRSFIKCNLKEFHQRHFVYVKKLFDAVVTDDRWRPYRTMTNIAIDDDEEEEEDVGADGDEDEIKRENEQITVKNEDESTNSLQFQDEENSTDESVELRIYGELYGGGGIDKPIGSAIQKEIIYADQFRFYVFGININSKWTTVTEMNDLCREAGFPYYAVPVCEPRRTVEELTTWLTTSGFMASRSKLTDRTDHFKTTIEG